MFINNLTTQIKEKVRDAVLVELDNIGFKNDVPKRISKSVRRPDNAGNVFRTPLDRLPMTKVRLPSGVYVDVPIFIDEACQLVLKNVGVEGIFRKTGSAARQRNIKVMLDAGHLESLGDHHVIDIASVLKLFLRELPESLVPAQWHEPLVSCLALGDNATPAILYLCLLLPPLNLAALAYLMQIFQEVASHSDRNKMDRSNLAIILAPTIMPVQLAGKASSTALRLNNHVQIIEILINNAQYIGLVPEYANGPVKPSVSSTSLPEGERVSLRRSLTRKLKKKRRRSASLTRMLNGLRKIVGGRGSPEGSSSEEGTPVSSQVSNVSTPCLKPNKKRKAQDMSASGLSTKKKREVLQLLPQSCALADTPFTPGRACASRTLSTPTVSIDPSPTREDKNSPKLSRKRFFRGRSASESERVEKSSKRSLLSMGGKVTKKPKRSGGGKEAQSGGFLERSWSAVSHTGNWGRRKLSQLSLLSTSTANHVDNDSETLVEGDTEDVGVVEDIGVDLSLSQNATTPQAASPPVICLSARQYADIKRRVSDIETKISEEMNNVLAAASVGSPEPLRAADTAQAVQTVYERTVEGSERLLDSSADRLARELGRTLKIRRRSEARVIRSPSARKIGSIRKELRRNKSWHTFQNVGNGSHLRRGKPNTVASGLPQHAPSRVIKPMNSTLATSSPDVSSSRTPNLNRAALPAAGAPPQRSSSFHVRETTAHSSAKKFSSQMSLANQDVFVNGSGMNEKWFDAVEQISRLRPRIISPAPLSHRDSIARLRNENAGMVLAKARLFGAATAPSRARPFLQLQPPVARDEVKTTVSTQTDGSSSTPRRQTTPNRSPAHGRNLRPRPSPPVASVVNEARKVKKHTSLRIDRAEVSYPVRRNLSTPSHWPDASRDKENRVGKPSANQGVSSPLRDSNRALPSTPAPAIKPSLGAKVQRRISATPTPRGVHGRPTPMRAYATPAGHCSPHLRSPRVAMGARALGTRSRH